MLQRELFKRGERENNESMYYACYATVPRRIHTRRPSYLCDRHCECELVTIAIIDRALSFGFPQNPNTVPRMLFTPLFAAVGAMNLAGVTCLIRHGADVNTMNITLRSSRATEVQYALLCVINRPLREYNRFRHIVRALLAADPDHRYPPTETELQEEDDKRTLDYNLYMTISSQLNEGFVKFLIEKYYRFRLGSYVDDYDSLMRKARGYRLRPGTYFKLSKDQPTGGSEGQTCVRLFPAPQL
jgi:hypothetical protein